MTPDVEIGSLESHAFQHATSSDVEMKVELTLRGEHPVALAKRLTGEGALDTVVNAMLTTVAVAAPATMSLQGIVSSAEAAVKGLLTQGAKAMEAQTAVAQETIENAMKQMAATVTAIAESAVAKGFEAVSKSSTELKTSLGENAKEVQTIIEKIVRAELGAHIQEILVSVKSAKAAKDAVAKTTLAGTDFQTAIHALLSEDLKGTSDTVEFVADAWGRLKRKTGDIVISSEIPMTGIKTRTVIECKNEDMSSPSDLSKVLEEIERAKENRNADTCVFLFGNEAQIPEGVGTLRFGPDFVIASADRNNPTLLYQVARFMAICKKKVELTKQTPEIDLSALETEIAALGKVLVQAQEAESKIRLAFKNAEKAVEAAQSMTSMLSTSIERLEMALQQALEESG
jgi:hypothetical protein